MNESYFYEKLRMIYGTFGKAFPAEHIRDAIFRRVEDLPDAFMDFALKRLENQESLPANLGMHLRQLLWPDYLEKHPRLKAKDKACPDCDPALPGLFWAWDAKGFRYRQKCACNHDPGFGHIQGLTRRQVEARGGFVHEQDAA